MPAPVIDICNGAMSARIATFGGCILNLAFAGESLLRPSPADDTPPIDSACYPLVPFGNRIRGNRFSFEGRDYRFGPNTIWDAHYLHGEGWRSDWEVTANSLDCLALAHSHDGSTIPYTYNATQSFRLLADGIELTLSVTNCGIFRLPFGIGWHPYFPMTPGTTLQTSTGRIWSEEAGWLPGAPGPVPLDLDFSRPAPLPQRWVNNGFEEWSGKARIVWPERRLALRIDADALFRSMFLFVSDTSFDPAYRRDFFALEPMSHLADGHNQPDLGGLVPLEPGATLAGSLRLTAEPLP